MSENIEVVKEILQNEVKSPRDLGWNDYVLSLLDDSEFQDGYPKLDGLRRIAEVLVGDLLESQTEVKEAASEANGHRATVLVHLSFSHPEYGNRGFSGAADASPSNVKGIFSKFPTAIAETRAEARALRKALRLRTVVAEELDNVTEDTQPANVPVKTGTITDTQKKAIELMCGNTTRGMNINVAKLVQSLLNKEANTLTAEDASAVLGKLNEMQRDKSLIVPELVGFDKNWV